MKTSYFGRANSKAFKDRGLRFVSVARSCKYWSGERYPDLFPTWDMIHMEDEVLYEELYREKVLSKLNPQKVYDDLKDAVILCHEKYDDIIQGKTFCHRHMIARWLEDELGVDIPELKDDKAELKAMLKK